MRFNVRKHTLVFLFCFIIFLKPSKAQVRDNVIKLNLFGLMGSTWTLFDSSGSVNGSFTVSYERVLDYESSIQISVGYRNYNFSTHDTTVNLSGITLVGEYRWYLKPLKRQAPSGLYLAPFVRYGGYKQKEIFRDHPEYDCTFHIDSWAGGLMLGYQFLIAKRIAIDIFLGGQFKSRMVKTTFNNPAAYYITPSQSTTFKVDNWWYDYIRFGVNAGIAF